MRSVTPRPRGPTFARLAFGKKCFHQHIPTLPNRNAIWRSSIIPAAIIQKQPSFTAHRSRVGKKRPISRQRITKSWLQILRTCAVRWAKPARRSSWKPGRVNDGADKFRARPYLVISACAREMAAQFNGPNFLSSRGGIGRRVRLRTVWGNPWRFESSREQFSLSFLLESANSSESDTVNAPPINMNWRNLRDRLLIGHIIVWSSLLCLFLFQSAPISTH